MEKTHKKCLITDCPNNLQSRGLCIDHYAYASYRIFKGIIQSWEEWAKKQEVRKLCSEVVIPKKAPFSLR